MTASEIIKRLGGAAQLSKALGLPVATGPLRIRAWSHRNAIPGTYWWPIAAYSDAEGLGVSLEVLASAHAALDGEAA